jgi:hypothetical protein
MSEKPELKFAIHLEFAILRHREPGQQALAELSLSTLLFAGSTH